MVGVIAERIVFGPIDGVEVQMTVRIHEPERDKQGDWSCSFTFEGNLSAHKFKDGVGWGVDSVQALTQALVGIGTALDKSGIEWSMFPESEILEGDSLLRLDDGFPRSGVSPGILGASFRRRMQAYVTRETEVELEALNEVKRQSLARVRKG